MLGKVSRQLKCFGRLRKPLLPYVIVQGGFAKCFKFVQHETNQIYACKVVDKESLHKAKAKSKVCDCEAFVCSRW